jgi:hypothetical protein
MGDRENGVRIVSSPPIQGRDPVRDGKLSLESSMNGAPLPACHPISAFVTEPATPISSDQCPVCRTGLSRPNASGPFPFLSLTRSGMLTTEDGPFVVPFVETGVRAVDKRVVPIVVGGYHTSPQGEGVAALVGQGTVLAFVPVQQAAASTPITLVGVSSFRLGWVGVGSSRAWEGQAGSFRLVQEFGDKA